MLIYIIYVSAASIAETYASSLRHSGSFTALLDEGKPQVSTFLSALHYLFSLLEDPHGRTSWHTLWERNLRAVLPVWVRLPGEASTGSLHHASILPNKCTSSQEETDLMDGFLLNHSRLNNYYVPILENGIHTMYIDVHTCTMILQRYEWPWS